MLRFTPIANARHAESYYSKSDGGYYLQAGDLHREWGGKAAEMLGLAGPPDYEQFKRLIHGLDPHTGEQLTAKLIEDRIPGWDVTASLPKGVTTALERGDLRIRDVLWWAGREAMADLEEMATTRVRKGGRQEDRQTGNLLWYAKEDPETRPTKEDRMPDWDRHIHFVVFNFTHDAVEDEWKAVKFRPIMDLRKYFSHRFDMYMSRGLSGLGYDIETKHKAEGSGGKRYYSWDIKGIPQSVLTKFSRRSAEVEKAEQEAVEAMKERDPDAPDELSAVARDKLGATSRLHKRDDLTLDDYREYWNAKITPEEGRQIAQTIQRAREGRNPKPANTADKGVAYAIGHEFARNSVVTQKQLEITAMERCMGGALPEEIEPELHKQGVLLIDGHATTEQVRAEEQRLVDFARQGRGRFRPLGDRDRPIARDWLNAGQRAAVKHVLASRDRVTVVRGVSGAGKTSLMQEAAEGIGEAGKKVVVLAPGTGTAFDVLRKDFPEANTVKRFLVDPRFQEQARGQVLWVDEAGQLGSEDMLLLFDQAAAVGARVVLSGDRRQHRSVARGEPLRLLEEKAGLPVAEVTEIIRQSGDYKQAVARLSEGKAAEAFDELDRLGWIRQVPDAERYQALASAYLEAVAEKKRGKPATALVISPTHAEAARVTEAIRTVLKAGGKLSKERTLPGWVPAQLTDPEKGEAVNYEPGDLLVFHQNVPGHQRGSHMIVSDPAKLPLRSAEHFQVYRPVELTLAVGDRARVTANGWDKSGKHRLNNGDLLTVAGFTPSGDIIDQRGWVIPASGGAHLALGYCVTSHASQGKTVDKVLVAQSSQSLAATNRRQFYVSVGRGRTQALVFTDDKKALLKAVQKADQPLSALELTQARQRKKTPLRQRLGKHLAYVRRLATFARTHERRPVNRQRTPHSERGIGYAR
jgi:conjugative relaxase-like TrwC/TraI family protein